MDLCFDTLTNIFCIYLYTTQFLVTLEQNVQLVLMTLNHDSFKSRYSALRFIHFLYYYFVLVSVANKFVSVPYLSFCMTFKIGVTQYGYIKSCWLKPSNPYLLVWWGGGAKPPTIKYVKNVIEVTPKTCVKASWTTLNL